MTNAIVSLIVAASENGVIGRDGDLPWRLPDDLKRFKALTTGHPIIMGHRTWESLGRPLPNRTNIVVTSRDDLDAPGVVVTHSLEAALAHALSVDDTEVFIIGGANLYAQAFERAGRLYLTRVHASIDGDVYCPPLDMRKWTLTDEDARDADERHAYAFTFRTFERRA